MKIKLLFLMLPFILLLGCGNKGEITQKHFLYEKVFYDTHKVEFDIYLENAGNPLKTSNLIKKLVYKNMDFDKYAEYAENRFTGETTAEDFPPMENINGEPYIYQSSYSEHFNIIHFDNSFVVMGYENYMYFSGAAHGIPWIDCYYIDVKEGRLLGIDDLFDPIPENVLKEMIMKEYGVDSFFRDNIWPPDAVNMNEDGIVLVWNVYTITPYAEGIIFIDIPDEIGNKYLTKKGKSIKSRIGKK